MNVWFMWTLYFVMWSGEIKGQAIVNNDQPSDELQHLAGLLNNVMQLLSKQQQQTRQLVQAQTRDVEQTLSVKLDRLTEVVGRLHGELNQQSRHLNLTVGRLHGELYQQSQQFNQTLRQQQGGLTSLNQSLTQLKGTLHQHGRNVADNILQRLELVEVGADLAHLFGGPNAKEGRLTVRVNSTSEWGTVCDDSFDNADASVACSMMGYGHAGPYLNNRYGQGVGSIHLDDLNCTGTEHSLWQCGHRGYKVHDCGHHEDVYISCW